MHLVRRRFTRWCVCVVSGDVAQMKRDSLRETVDIRGGADLCVGWVGVQGLRYLMEPMYGEGADTETFEARQGP